MSLDFTALTVDSAPTAAETLLAASQKQFGFAAAGYSEQQV